MSNTTSNFIPLKGSFLHCQIGSSESTASAASAATPKLYIIKSGSAKKIQELLEKTTFLFDYLATEKDPLTNSCVAEYFWTEKINGMLSLSTEYLGSDLHQHLHQVPNICSVERASRLTVQACNALGFLESKDILLPKITPKDFFITPDGQILKIGNLEEAFFNHGSFIVDEDKTPLSVEDLFYLSPEYLQTKTACSTSPMWNMGLIAAEIFYTQLKKTVPAIQTKDFVGLIEKPLKEVGALSGENIDQTNLFVDFLRHLLISSKIRYTARQSLTHPFLTQTTTALFFPEKTKDTTTKGFNSFVKKLGSGSFGTVVEGLTKGNVPCAIKKANENEGDLDALNREDLFLRILSGAPSIIQRLDCFDLKDSVSGKPIRCLSLEKMDMNLHQATKQRNGFTFDTIRSLGRQLLQGLCALKDKGIIHLDLKPENILVKGDFVKISDFGSACFAKSTCALDSLYKVSRWYRAPELLLEIIPTPATDMWSLGAVVAECFTNTPLFLSPSHRCLVPCHEFVLQRPYPRSLLANAPREGNDLYNLVHTRNIYDYSKSIKRFEHLLRLRNQTAQENRDSLALFKDLIGGMLAYSMNDRLTTEDALNHPFFNPSLAIIPPAETASEGSFDLASFYGDSVSAEPLDPENLYDGGILSEETPDTTHLDEKQQKANNDI